MDIRISSAKGGFTSLLRPILLALVYLSVILALPAPSVAVAQDSQPSFKTCQEALAAGEKLLENDQFKEAQAAFEQALEIARKAADRKGEGQALLGLGKTLSELGDHPTARTHLEKALEVFRSLDDRSGEAAALHGLGSSIAAAGDQAKALEYFEKALSLQRETGDRHGEAEVLSSMGESRYSLHQLPNALESFEKALLLFREAGDRDGEAKALATIGQICNELGQKAKALEYYEKALSAEREVGDRRGEAITLNEIGVLYDDFGQKAKALEYFEKSLPIRREVGERIGEATTLGNIGLIYSSLGQKTKALEYYEKALSIKRETGDRRGEANILSNIGAVYSSLGQKAKALEYLEKALPIKRELGDRRGEASTLNNMGMVCMDLGQKAKALEYYEKALPIRREVGDKSGEAISLNNIGGVYQTLGQHAKALEYFEQAFTIRHELGDRSGEANTLINIGGVLYDLDQKAKELEYYEKALPILREVGNRRVEAIALFKIGVVYAGLGQNAKAMEYYEQALPIRREVGDRAGEARTLNDIMKVTEPQNQPHLAVLQGKQSVNLYQALRGDIRTLSSESRKSYLQTVESSYRNLAGLLLRRKRPAEAHQVLSLLKEQEYFDFAQGFAKENEKSPLVDFTPLEARMDTRYQQALEAVAKAGGELTILQFKKQRTPEEETRLAGLQAAHEEAQKAFEATLAAIGKEMEEQGPKETARLVPSPATELWADLQTMGKGTAVVYTLMTEDRAWLVGLTPGDLRAWEVKIPRKDLEATVEAFRKRLRNPGLDPRPLGKQLYDALVAPLRDWRQEKKVTRILWSLDGILRYVPMGALWNGKRYFIEELPGTVFTPAARMKMAAGAGTLRALAAGVSKSHEEFPPLEGVPDELGSVVKQAGRTGGVLPGRVLLDESFTEAALREGLKLGYPVLHLASHFQFSPAGEHDSFLLLGDGSRLSLEAMRTGEPLFQGLDLVTLSACQTGMGGQGAMGQEIEGFGVMAQRQGAGAVIATLWPVSDASTSVLMQGFYRAWSRPGTAKADALRQAQLALLRGQTKVAPPKAGRGGPQAGEDTVPSGRFIPPDNAPCAHPYYWAPFILMGSWK